MVKKCKDIYAKSKELYSNIRKKGKNGISSKWAYYFCKAILNGKKDVATVTQSDAPNATGVAINQKLSKAELPNISGSYQLHGQENGSIVYNITGHATGTQISGKYKTISTSTSGAWSQQNIGFAFGSGQAHNNMPPYMKVYMWKRTA